MLYTLVALVLDIAIMLSYTVSVASANPVIVLATTAPEVSPSVTAVPFTSAVTLPSLFTVISTVFQASAVSALELNVTTSAPLAFLSAALVCAPYTSYLNVSGIPPAALTSNEVETVPLTP